MKNKHFPNWKNANDILNKFIDDHFGLYISKPTTEVVYITVLPEDLLAKLVPAEEFLKLNELSRNFTAIVKESMTKYGTDGHIDNSLPSAHAEFLIKGHFKLVKKMFKKENGISLKNKLKEVFGLRESLATIMLKELESRVPPAGGTGVKRKKKKK